MKILKLTPLEAASALLAIGIFLYDRIMTRVYCRSILYAVLFIALIGFLFYLLGRRSLKGLKTLILTIFFTTCLIFISLYGYRSADPGSGSKSARVVGIPVYNRNRVSFTARVNNPKKFLWKPRSTEVWVIINDFNSPVERGDWIKFTRDLKPIDRYSSYYGEYLFSRGINYTLNAKKNEVEVIKGNWYYRLINSSKAYIERVNDRLISYPQSAFLTSLLTGDRSNLPESLKDSFIRSGSFHILAVSGMHLGFVVFLSIVVMKLIGLNHIVRTIVLVVPVLLYTVFIGNSPSILRAALMVFIGIIVYLLDRDRDYLNILSAVFLILLVVNPKNIFNPGFLLSFTAAFGIVFLAPLLYSMTAGPVPGYIRGLLSASAGAVIYTFPVLISYFKIFPYISVLTNIFVIPLTMVAFFLDLIIIALYGVFLPAANILALCEDMVVKLLIRTGGLFSKIKPVKIKSFHFDKTLFIFACFLLFIVLTGFARSRRHIETEEK